MEDLRIERMKNQMAFKILKQKLGIDLDIVENERNGVEENERNGGGDGDEENEINGDGDEVQKARRETRGPSEPEAPGAKLHWPLDRTRRRSRLEPQRGERERSD